MKSNTQSNQYVFNYMQFRVIIGILGISLPVLLWFFSGLLSNGNYWIQPSISHYYYSVMHFFFMAVLILLGFFLILYKGIGTVKHENLVSTIAGVFALLVALFPTDVSGFNGYIFIELSTQKHWYNYIHFGSAGGLFICFTIFCFYFFQMSDHIYTTPEEITKKKRRNLTYKICGWLITFSIIGIGLFSYVFTNFASLYFVNYVFVFEWIALWSFGTAWFIKGSELFEKIKLLKILR